jgi:hypothetical protein
VESNAGFMADTVFSYGQLVWILLLWMPSGILCRVALVITDVSENISPPSSAILMVIGFHSCVTFEVLLISLSIEEYYCILGCFDGSINYRCLLGLCTM